MHHGRHGRLVEDDPREDGGTVLRSPRPHDGARQEGHVRGWHDPRRHQVRRARRQRGAHALHLLAARGFLQAALLQDPQRLRVRRARLRAPGRHAVPAVPRARVRGCGLLPLPRLLPVAGRRRRGEGYGTLRAQQRGAVH